MRKLLVLLAVTILTVAAAGQTSLPVSGSVTTTYNVAAHGKPTVALANLGAGVCTTGAHLIKVAYVTAAGVSTLSAASDAATIAAPTTNGQIRVTVAASTNPSVTSVNIYMTEAAGSSYYLAASGVANSSADTILNLADATLITQGAAPTVDASMTDTVVMAPSPYGFHQLIIKNLDTTNDVYVSLDGSVVDTTNDYRIQANCTPKCEETFYGTNGCPIKSVRMRSQATNAGCSVVYWGVSQ